MNCCFQQVDVVYLLWKSEESNLCLLQELIISLYETCEVILIISFLWQQGEGTDITANIIPGDIRHVWRKCESTAMAGEGEKTCREFWSAFLKGLFFSQSQWNPSQAGLYHSLPIFFFIWQHTTHFVDKPHSLQTNSPIASTGPVHRDFLNKSTMI